MSYAVISDCFVQGQCVWSGPALLKTAQMFSVGLKLKREEFDNLSLTGNGTVCRQLRLIQSVDSYSGCDEADLMDEFC